MAADNGNTDDDADDSPVPRRLRFAGIRNHNRTGNHTRNRNHMDNRIRS